MSLLKGVQSWKEEKRSAYLYHLLAKQEVDIIRKKLFLELADGANEQALLWEKKIREHNKEVPLFFHPDFRTRVVGVLLKYLGAKRTRFILSAMKVRGMSIFSGAPGSHVASTQLEQRHKGMNAAGNLRAAVFGVNDGLVSNMSLLLGMMGAHVSHHTLVISGMAGLLAGACSMAAGEYISVRSQKEFFEYQINLEKEELELYPEEEAAELAAIYRARGLSAEDATVLANKMISNPDTALDTLAREELGLNPTELGSPLGAAISSFLSFALGAVLPVLPFLISESVNMIYVSLGLTAMTLMIVGATVSLFSNQGALKSGFRMLLIGTMAGVVTYFVGMWLGAFV